MTASPEAMASMFGSVWTGWPRSRSGRSAVRPGPQMNCPLPAKLTVGEESREIGPGDSWYAPAGVPHGGEILGEEEAVFRSEEHTSELQSQA